MFHLVNAVQDGMRPPHGPTGSVRSPRSTTSGWGRAPVADSDVGVSSNYPSVALIETDTISAVGQFERGVSCVGYGYVSRARWYRHAGASI